MNAASPTTDERARKNLTTILQGLARVGQTSAAEAMKVSESTVSRMKDSDLERLAALLAVMGLKVVPVQFKCYRPDDIEPYIQLARQHMRTVTSVHDLLDDDPE